MIVRGFWQGDPTYLSRFTCTTCNFVLRTMFAPNILQNLKMTELPRDNDRALPPPRKRGSRCKFSVSLMKNYRFFCGVLSEEYFLWCGPTRIIYKDLVPQRNMNHEGNIYIDRYSHTHLHAITKRDGHGQGHMVGVRQRDPTFLLW